MKNKINLVITLMTLCTLFLLGLQFYWNYQSYRSNVRVFTSDINDALDKAVEQQMNIKRDAFAVQYKKWMADTSLIKITCHYGDTVKATIFTVQDTHPPFSNRRPFSMGINTFTEHLNVITPAAKNIFIDSFVKNVVSSDLKSGSDYYYTQRLGDLLSAAYKNDKLDTVQFAALYKKELAKRDIDNTFHLHLATYVFKGYNVPNEPIAGLNYGTRSFKYGFSSPMVAINAYFPNPNIVFLQKMKWILLCSLILIGITIVCFTYTVKTMLSQKKLAELKDDFINNMTHELKTPVSTISVAAEAIQDFKVNESTSAEYMGIIRYQAANLTSLIDRILKSLVSENTPVSLQKERLLLNSLLDNCLTQYKPVLQASKAKITVNMPADVWINGDEGHLGNIMANLLDNAIKYGNEQPQIVINVFQIENYGVFSITNDGAGIPPEYRDKVFGRFFRVPTGNTHNVKGYGLGLSYVSDIINRHGGKIELSSSDVATTFTIYLPLA